MFSAFYAHFDNECISIYLIVELLTKSLSSAIGGLHLLYSLSTATINYGQKSHDFVFCLLQKISVQWFGSNSTNPIVCTELLSKFVFLFCRLITNP